MKINFTLSVLAFFLLAATYKYNSGLSPIIVTAVEDIPNLPATPYDYSVTIPSHILSTEDTIGGYSIGEVDPTLVNDLEDDIATLGRVLFYDKKLSANENMSCASCHFQTNSFSDPNPLSQGVAQITKRNSLHLNDLGWTNNESFFWNKAKQGLTEAIGLPLKDDNEIGANLNDLLYKLNETPYYQDLFTKAYGNDDMSEERILTALSQFINSMNTFNSKFDKVKNGLESFSEAEQAGESVFTRACAECHVQGNNLIFIDIIFDPMFEAELFSNGYQGKVPDLGANEGMPEGTKASFKMPTLRNVALTAPYMHDGGINTLDSLINFYANADKDNAGFFMSLADLTLNSMDKTNLKAFLLTLTDQSFATNPKWSDPFEKATFAQSENLASNVKIMPNPFNYAAEIQVKDYPNQRKNISVKTVSGQNVLTDYFFGDSYLLKRDKLQPGIYFVSVMCNNKMGSYKVMVQ